MREDILLELPLRPKGISLISCLLDIQNCRENEPRSFQSSQFVDCLAIKDANSVAEQRRTSHELNRSQVPFADRHFVAVSYRCNESLPRRAYRVAAGHGWRAKRTDAPDIIIDGAIAYLKHHSLTSFWIDKECIDQRDRIAKQRAMQDMDLMYRCSDHPLGILTTPIYRQRQINILQCLLRNEYVSMDGEDPQLARHIGFWKARKILDVLVYLMGDPWWTRRWTFQEEYCGSVRMRLLVPHGKTLVKDRMPMGDISGQLLINAADFRRCVTMFCLACQNSAIFRAATDQEMCRKVLHRARTYRMLRRYNWTIEDDSLGRAMSLRVLEDICDRSITRQEDTLDIMANCCGYIVRLNPYKCKKTTRSLGLAIMTLYLLNGEILKNDDRAVRPAHALQLLKALSFNKFDPPSDSKALTFMKRWRLVDVRLTEAGVSTVGHLWHVQEEIQLEKFHSRFQQNSDGYKKAHLDRLAHMLEGSFPSLSCCLRQCLDDGVMGYLKKGGLKPIFEQMLSALCEASCSGKDLLVASFGTNPTQYAIFVRPRRCNIRPRVIFTSHQSARFLPKIGKYQSPAKYVSFLVSQRGSSDGISRLILRHWVNGLCFLDDAPQTSVIFPWPAALRQMYLPQSIQLAPQAH